MSECTYTACCAPFRRESKPGRILTRLLLYRTSSFFPKEVLLLVLFFFLSFSKLEISFCSQREETERGRIGGGKKKKKNCGVGVVEVVYVDAFVLCAGGLLCFLCHSGWRFFFPPTSSFFCSCFFFFFLTSKPHVEIEACLDVSIRLRTPPASWGLRQ